MFRRTFARHVARHDTTNLLALQEHFKHASLWMTDYYVASDHELWTLLHSKPEPTTTVRLLQVRGEFVFPSITLSRAKYAFTSTFHLIWESRMNGRPSEPKNTCI